MKSKKHPSQIDLSTRKARTNKKVLRQSFLKYNDKFGRKRKAFAL